MWAPLPLLTALTGGGLPSPLTDGITLALAARGQEAQNKACNDDGQRPGDLDAKITKMMDGTTHLTHTAEHAVDLGEQRSWRWTCATRPPATPRR